jgi:D-methionine transport system substrate-binding protein
MSKNEGTKHDPNRGYSIDTGKKKRRNLLTGLGVLILVVAVAVVVINATKGDDASAKNFGDNLKIGYNSAFASEQRLLEFVNEEIAPDYGLTIEPVSIADPQQIDRSVSEGILAGTIYEHKHWMNFQKQSGGFEVEAVLPIYKWAFAVYSDKHDSLEDLPDGATIAVPDDPSNQSQALWQLEKAGLIKLDPDVDPWTVQLADVTENPHNYNLKPLGLAVMPRALQNLDAAMSYVDFFDSADVPADKEIASPIAPDEFDAQLVIGTKYADDPSIDKLKELWADPRIQEYIEKEGKPAIFPVTAG